MPNDHLRCNQVIDHLLDYIAKELPPEVRGGVEKHLAGCDACVEYLRTYQATVLVGKAALESEPQDLPPEELIRRILQGRS